jgi:Zn-dependent peptidase ImmA (M78 family)
MLYLDFIFKKLKTDDIRIIVDKAILYLGDAYPEKKTNKKGYELVNQWLNQIIRAWNIELIELNLTDSKFLAKIEPKYKGFIINYNKNLYKTQLRYTIAHEIAHILSYDGIESWPTYQVFHSTTEERYCDKIARSILLPKTLIDLNDFNLASIEKDQIELISKLRLEYRVAPWRILQRVLDDSLDNEFIGIIWEYLPKEHYLRIMDYHHPNNVFIPRNDRIFLNDLFEKKFENHIPAEAFVSNKLCSGTDLINIGSLYKKELFCSAFPIATSSTTYIFQIINLNSDPTYVARSTISATSFSAD